MVYLELNTSILTPKLKTHEWNLEQYNLFSDWMINIAASIWAKERVKECNPVAQTKQMNQTVKQNGYHEIT
jgi:hypothetical protein